MSEPAAHTTAAAIRNRRLEELIAVLAESGDPPIFTTTALEIPRWTVRVLFGAAWLKLYRVALVVTRRRVLEVALGVKGRLGRIRSFSSSTLEVGKEGLYLSLEGRRHPSWRPLSQPSSEQITALRALSIFRAQASDRGDADGPGDALHCPNCLEEREAEVSEAIACPACSAVLPSGRQGARLALVWPGAGLLYAGWTARGVVTALGESLLILAWIIIWLGAGEWTTTLAIIIGFPPVLFLMKLEAMAAAKELSGRAPAMTAERNSRWRTIALAGTLVTAAVLILPITFRGILNNEVNGELRLFNAWQDWREVEVGDRVAEQEDLDEIIPDFPRPGKEIPDTTGAGLGAAPTVSEVRTFLHISGLEATLTSEPVPRWLPLGVAAGALRRTLDPVPGDLQRQRLAHHTVFVGYASQGETVTLHYLVIDSRHRDVHHFRAQTGADRRRGAQAALEGLVRRTHLSGV